VRAAAGDCGNGAWVRLIGTRVVFSNFTGAMRGLLPYTVVRSWTPRPLAGVLDTGGTVCAELP